MSAVKIHSLRIEEQTLFNYAKKKYYPVHPSELFHDRYRTIAKLGWGAYSTVWLTRDERLERRLSKERDHPGLLFSCLADDIFEIDGLTGRHYCIAMKPQGVSARTLQDFFYDGKLPKLLVKSLIHRLLFAINW
ncbi:hypothetical protein LTR09_001309 [Extremus antarcticus]|uniref:non-specific serine/threonine protein kinase n=1 Tax=Extremus antarcticus TaxID=702011 RepID=A0AAJ0GIK4_9PEZI|nr:hypothetical protein LTR09_001309 [Extremus antarcticus]